MRDNQVILPAIFELRYAGRKLVDAFKTAQETDLSSDESARKIVHRDLADAVENCVKSNHDSIDAVIFFVTKWFAKIEDCIDIDEIQKLFPEYFRISSELGEIQIKVIESRKTATMEETKFMTKLALIFMRKLFRCT